MENKPAIDQDTGTQLLSTVEEVLHPAADNSEVTLSVSDDEESGQDLEGTDRDKTGEDGNMATES